jgi:hypothetical protein
MLSPNLEMPSHRKFGHSNWVIVFKKVRSFYQPTAKNVLEQWQVSRRTGQKKRQPDGVKAANAFGKSLCALHVAMI